MFSLDMFSLDIRASCLPRSAAGLVSVVGLVSVHGLQRFVNAVGLVRAFCIALFGF